jgi:hypothetical protein
MDKLINLTFHRLLVLFLFFSGHLVHAQQPVRDTLLSPKPNIPNPVRNDTVFKPRFVLVDSLSYRFMGDGNFSRGNVNRSLMNLRAEIILQGPAVDIVSHPRFTYGQQNNVLAERDIYADLFVDVFKKRKVYAFGLATIERSNLRRIDWRRVAGAGLGLRLLQTRHHTLTLTNAVIHESTDFRERPTLTTQRNSTRLKGKHSLLADKMRITHITFLQPALADFSNLRWNTLITLELPLTWWLALRTSFENSYESVVEPTRKQNDTRLTFGISVGNRPL